MSTDNEMKGALGGAYWDDLRAPVTAINPPGAESDPDLDASTGLLLFDAGGTELVFLMMQMPKLQPKLSLLPVSLMPVKTARPRLELSPLLVSTQRSLPR